MVPSRRWRLQLLLLLLLLRASAATDPECQIATAGGSKECKCEIGKALTLKISTAAEPGSSFKWKDPKNNAIKADDVGYDLDTESKSLKIKNLKAADAGIYKAEYTLQSASKTEEFTVQPLVVCDASSTCKVNKGNNVRLKSGSSTTTWKFKDGTLPPRATEESGNVDIINLDAEEHNGVYTAGATTITVEVTAKAIVESNQSGNKIATESGNKIATDNNKRVVVVKASSKAITGTRFTLVCAVTGSSATATVANNTYEWQKDGQVMVNQKGATAIFPALQKTDAGTYVCKVGADQSAGYPLTVTTAGGAVAASYSPALLMTTLSLLHVLLRLVCY